MDSIFGHPRCHQHLLHLIRALTGKLHVTRFSALPARIAMKDDSGCSSLCFQVPQASSIASARWMAKSASPSWRSLVEFNSNQRTSVLGFGESPGVSPSCCPACCPVCWHAACNAERVVSSSMPVAGKCCWV